MVKSLALIILIATLLLTATAIRADTITVALLPFTNYETGALVPVVVTDISFTVNPTPTTSQQLNEWYLRTFDQSTDSWVGDGSELLGDAVGTLGYLDTGRVGGLVEPVNFATDVADLEDGIVPPCTPPLCASITSGGSGFTNPTGTIPTPEPPAILLMLTGALGLIEWNVVSVNRRRRQI